MAAVFWFHVLLDSYLRDHFGVRFWVPRTLAGPFWRPQCGRLFFAVVLRHCAFWPAVVFFFGSGIRPWLRSLVSKCVHMCREFCPPPGGFSPAGGLLCSSFRQNQNVYVWFMKSSSKPELHTFSSSDHFFVQKTAGV